MFKSSRKLPNIALATIYSYLTFSELRYQAGRLSKIDRAILKNWDIQQEYGIKQVGIMINIKKGNVIDFEEQDFIIKLSNNITFKFNHFDINVHDQIN